MADKRFGSLADFVTGDTLESAGKKLGKTKSTICKWLNGKRGENITVYQKPDGSYYAVEEKQL